MQHVRQIVLMPTSIQWIITQQLSLKRNENVIINPFASIKKTCKIFIARKFPVYYKLHSSNTIESELIVLKIKQIPLSILVSPLNMCQSNYPHRVNDMSDISYWICLPSCFNSPSTQSQGEEFRVLLTRPRIKTSNQQTSFRQSNTQEYAHGLEGLIAK